MYSLQLVAQFSTKTADKDKLLKLTTQQTVGRKMRKNESDVVSSLKIHLSLCSPKQICCLVPAASAG